MTTYAVTGASGPFGRTVVEQLIERGVVPSDIVAVVRTPEKVADLAERGVVVRTGDYDRPDTLASALAGVTRLLLVSGSEVGKRVVQHGNVIDAARGAGVERIAYTSVVRADDTPLVIAPEHKATEELIVASGLPYTLLRNNWYLENYTPQLATYLAQGAVTHAAEDGRVAAATRADLAEAAAVALLEEGTDNAVYELGGQAFTFAELAAAVSEVSGAQVVERRVSVDELAAALTGAGLDQATAGFYAAVEANIAQGALDSSANDLATLIGRPPTTLVDALRAA